MKIIGRDKTYIDYFQGICRLPEGLKNRFGIRAGEGLCKPWVPPIKREEPMPAAANGAERLPNTSEQVYEGKSKR